MKTLVTIAIFIISINANSQKLVRDYYDWAKTKIKREYYTDAYGTLNGPYKAYSEYGGILKQGQCKDDGPIGKWIENYDNGKLHYIKIYDTPGTYDFQVNNGKVTSYYEDGKTIKYERNFKNMELDGVWKEYNEKGIITKEGIYINGVFEPTGITKVKYDEEQEKQKQLEAERLLKKTEDYKKIIPEADSAFTAEDYGKALRLYKSASDLLGNEKYPKERIAFIIETYHSNSKFFSDYIKSQYDSLAADFNSLKQNFKVRSVWYYNEYSHKYQEKYPTTISGNPYYCDCKTPWNEEKYATALKCFEMNKEFYEPYQRAITESFFKYEEALTREETNIKKSSVSFYFENTNNQFYTYERNIFLANLNEAKTQFELGKSVLKLYNSVIEKKNQINTLNDQNKKKTLLKKYLIVYEDYYEKYNDYISLSETIKVLHALSTLTDKVIKYYSENTKELEAKLKKTDTSEQIQVLLFGQ